MKATRRQQIATYTLLALFAVAMILPFYYMVITSLKSTDEASAPTISLVVHHPTLSPYTDLLKGSLFLRSALNSLLIALLTTAGTIFLCPLAGYAFAKHRFPGRDFIFVSLLATMMIPGTVLLVPGFLLFRDFGWLDSWLPLIVPGLAGVFGVFLSRQFIDKLPDSLIDSAKMDGLPEWGIFMRLVMPLSKPLLATLAIFTFLGSWNSFIGPLIFLQDEKKFTLPLVIAMLQGRFQGKENVQMAGAVMSILPVLIVFFVFQKQIVESLASTGLKKADVSGWVGAILLVWAMGIAYFALWQAVLRLTDGNFTYNLDDAYIHLAIAKNFAFHGVWGVTPYETASAASSPLWILLLAGAMKVVGDNAFLPLLLGIFFSVAATLFVYSRFQKAGIKPPLAALGAIAIYLIGMLHLLPFTGMEHCLQIFLDLLFGFWMIDVFSREPERRDLALGAILTTLMCLCRYESVFLLVVPVLFCLWQKRWRLAISIAAGPVIGIGGFGLCSVLGGMPFIPNSIILKGNLPHTTVAAFLGHLSQRTFLYLHFASFAMWDLWVLAILAAITMQKSNLREETKGLRFWIWTLVVATVLHSGFANVGFFYRYEAYLIVCLASVVVLSLNQLLRATWPWQEEAVSAKAWLGGIVAVCCGQGLLYFLFWFYQLNFNLLILLYLVGLLLLGAMTRPPLTWGKFGKVVLAAVVPAALLFMANDRAKAGFHDVPKASQDIYFQQRQMARFVDRYYSNGRLAVNDIGAVTYFTHVHLLDLIGLASDPVRKIRLEHRFTTETADELIRRFQPDLVIVYPDWFTGKESLPKWLIPVGDWTIPPVTSAGSRKVVFYATNLNAARRLRAQLVEFAASLPREVTPR